jgi:glycerophosphoryl diester phosphodiesterase
MIELDTHLTSDGIFIINHDRRIRYEKKKYLISKIPLRTIENIQLPNGEGVPILEDVLKKLSSKIQFNIEIKCKVNKQIFDSLLERVGCDLSKILVSSFRLDVMDVLKSSNLDYKLGYLYRFPSFVSREISTKTYIHSLHPSHKFLSSRIVLYYHKMGKKVYVWTVNKESHIRRLVRLGVDGIITDNPTKTRKIIELIE